MNQKATYKIKSHGRNKGDKILEKVKKTNSFMKNVLILMFAQIMVKVLGI